MWPPPPPLSPPGFFKLPSSGLLVGEGHLPVPCLSVGTTGLGRVGKGMRAQKPKDLRGSVRLHPALSPLGSLAVLISPRSGYSGILVNVCLEFESRELMAWNKETEEDREKCMRVGTQGAPRVPPSALTQPKASAGQCPRVPRCPVY